MNTTAPAQQKEEEKWIIDEKIVSCDICLDILYNPLNTAPCNHKFCASCIRQWYDIAHSCPRCRVHIESLTKDSFVHEVVDAFLKSRPEKQRSDAACREADRLELQFLQKDLDYTFEDLEALQTDEDSFEADSMDEDSYYNQHGDFVEQQMRARVELLRRENPVQQQQRNNGPILRRHWPNDPLVPPVALNNRQQPRQNVVIGARARVNGALIAGNGNRVLVHNPREVRMGSPVRTVDLDETASSADTPPRRVEAPPRRNFPAVLYPPPSPRVFRDTPDRRQRAEAIIARPVTPPLPAQQLLPVREAPYRLRARR